jgi:hypothetical protein
MNLKETIISSFFFHLILFFLIAAVSSYTNGFSGSLQNIISVDLTVENSEDQAAARIDPAGEPPRTAGPPPKEEVSLPDQAADNPPGESKKIPEPEKKAEAIPGPVKIENAEKPVARRGGFTSLESYHQFIMLHRRIFGQKAGVRVNELIGEALRENTRDFYGGTGIVTLKFGPDRELSGVVVDSASPDLKAFLEEVGWDAVPAPAAYLGHTVQIEFTVLEGYLSFRINTL